MSRRCWRLQRGCATLAAASLAQVYKVTLPGGRPAVVKIQRPEIREAVRADMALLRRASRIVARAAPRFNEVIEVGKAVVCDCLDATSLEKILREGGARREIRWRAEVGEKDLGTCTRRGLDKEIAARPTT